MFVCLVVCVYTAAVGSNGCWQYCVLLILVFGVLFAKIFDESCIYEGWGGLTYIFVTLIYEIPSFGV